MFGPGGFGSTLFSSKLSRSQPGVAGRDVKQIAAELAQRARTAVARKHSSLLRKSGRRGAARRVRLASSALYSSSAEQLLQEEQEEEFDSDVSDESDIGDTPQGDATWRTGDRFAAAVASVCTAIATATGGSNAPGVKCSAGHTAAAAGVSATAGTAAASHTAGATAAVVKRAASTTTDAADYTPVTTTAVSETAHTDGAVAQQSWQAHDYHSAAAAALRSLSTNVRDPPTLSLLRAATSELAAYPRRSDFAATVQLQLGCTVATATSKSTAAAAGSDDGGGVLGEGKHLPLVSHLIVNYIRFFGVQRTGSL
jgi:trimeric autotransporter adhesin